MSLLDIIGILSFSVVIGILVIFCFSMQNILRRLRKDMLEDFNNSIRQNPELFKSEMMSE